MGALILSAATPVAAQAPVRQTASPATGRFVAHTFQDGSGEHKYQVFIPAGYRPDKPVPAILFLHGAGERGKDNHLQITAGLGPHVQARAKTFPFLVVFPQCESSEARILEAWQSHSPDGRRALLALDDAQKRYSVDPKRVILSGWSMGAYGTWSLAIADPGRWAGVMPLAGGGDVDKVAALKGTPVWAFHGALDKLVKAEEDRKMVEALQAAGGKATYTEFPDVGHYLCDNAFGNEAVFQWMLNPRTAPAELNKGPLVRPVPPIEVPFVPAVEIPQAVAIRLGNDALAALSYSLPATVPPEMLTGRLNDMFDSTVQQGRSFSVQFYGLSYSGKLERVLTRGLDDKTLLVQLGLRNVTITIGGTSIVGERHSAQAGPINIVIGHQAPVWLSLVLAPRIENRQIRLKQVGVSFQIPPDNWYVTQPAGVSVQGFGMTRDAVVEGLTSGLYGSRGRIENEVVTIVPGIIQQIEKALVLPDTGSPVSQSGAMIAKLWPLPIYPPRLRIWPEAISTDENGISLVVGLTAASLDPYGPAKPLRKVDGAGAVLTRLPTDKQLHAMVAPQVLTPLTEMAVEADMLKLDLRDIPDQKFAVLTDRATLQEIIPDLKRYGDKLQVRSSLRIAKPMEAGDATKPAEGDHPPFEFRVPGVQISIAIKTDPDQKEWQPCAVFDMDVSEQVSSDLSKPAHDRRVVSLNWREETRVEGTGRFVEGYQPSESLIDSDRYLKLFQDSWQKFSKGSTVAEMEVPDLTIGVSRLRLHDLRWRTPLVEVSYHLARIKISNLSNEPFTYETKAPTSPWGPPLTLKPGDTHEFEIPYPLTYRRRTRSGTEVYTLETGSHSEFRVPLAGGDARLFAANRVDANLDKSRSDEKSKSDSKPQVETK